ncbi:serine/threonine-protein kinase [Chondromyces crocatus]|uniref:Protein kinase n=1 Tax=Chondromyces crocatus TaxID=52 RepID=A0A0K1EKM1_CHOCO|nr:serine/threonine-protein kinase [Chondromyces crocatus]AKT41424.1 protein kinase [Chondromyces crocatus]
MATAQPIATSSNAPQRPFNSEELPRRFGRYLLLRRLARGGMGEVFLASTAGFEGAERPVVVKVIRREHAADPSFIARFLDEARVQAQLQHSGVAQILEADIDEESGEPFVVVEHVEGRSLGDVRARAAQVGHQIGWSEAVAIATLIAEGLAHVHERKDAAGRALAIVHRDLSPQNVMVGFAGDVKIIDFGTARGQNRRCHTVAGVVFAKPGYVAPEVANGDPGDARVDLYALGIILWELCAGRRFLQGDAQAHLAAVAQNRTSPPPISASTGAPVELDGLIARLTSFQREERYGSSREAARDLAALLAVAEPLPSGERGIRARAAHFMHALFPGEPGRARREFSEHLADARARGLGRHRPVESGGRPPVAPETSQASAEAEEVPREPMKGRERAAGGHRAGAEAFEAPGSLPGTRYQLLREVGRGAFSVVYEAEHVDLGRRLALKVMLAEHAGSQEIAARFRREARVLSALAHDGLVKVHDFGVATDGRLFCGMDLCEGESLETRLSRERVMDWREAFAMALPVLSTLERVHAEGVVHRDLKPGNVFLLRAIEGGASAVSGQGAAATLGGLRVKLLDFGLATGPDDAAEPGLTPVRSAVAVVGTPEYMAPEQASTGRVDGRADLYALGCMLFEMITGKLPFVASSTVALLEAKTRGSPERVREVAPERQIPRHVDELVMRALARHPSVRFSSAAEMRSALEAALATPARQRTRRRVAGSLVLTAAVALAALAFSGKGSNVVDLGARAASFLPWRAQPAVVFPHDTGSAQEAERATVSETASVETQAGTPVTAEAKTPSGEGPSSPAALAERATPSVDLVEAHPAAVALQGPPTPPPAPKSRPRGASRAERNAQPASRSADAGAATAATSKAATSKKASADRSDKGSAPEEAPSATEATTKREPQQTAALRASADPTEDMVKKVAPERATDADDGASQEEAKRRRKRKSRRAKAD